MIGQTKFNDLARGQIPGIRNGLLKMVADPAGEYLLGVQTVGEGATELIHVGQMALRNATTVDSFVENIFNLTTLAETYRVAALDIVDHVKTDWPRPPHETLTSLRLDILVCGAQAACPSLSAEDQHPFFRRSSRSIASSSRKRKPFTGLSM